MIYGSEGVQTGCGYQAGIKKKFSRTETSASMKPMLGQVSENVLDTKDLEQQSEQIFCL